jgi:hypothetical protein
MGIGVREVNRSQGADEVRAFIDDADSAVMVKVISAGADPVEMTPTEARHFAHALLELAEELDQIDSA